MDHKTLPSLLPRFREPGLLHHRNANTIVDVINGINSHDLGGTGQTLRTAFPVPFKIITRIEDRPGVYAVGIYSGALHTRIEGEIAPEWFGSYDDELTVFLWHWGDLGTNGHILAPGFQGVAHVIGSTDSGAPILEFSSMRGLFPVYVYKDGGTAGNSSETCSFSYTIKDAYGGILASGKTPLVPRIANVEYEQAPDGSKAVAFFFNAEAMDLWQVTERPVSEAC